MLVRLVGRVLLDRLQHLKDRHFRVFRLLVENVRHELIKELVDPMGLQVSVDALHAAGMLSADAQHFHLVLNFLNLVRAAHSSLFYSNYLKYPSSIKRAIFLIV